MRVGVSFSHDLRSAICINFSGSRGIVERVLIIHDLRSAICIHFSRDKGMGKGIF